MTRISPHSGRSALATMYSSEKTGMYSIATLT